MHNADSFIREIQEDVRRDRAAALLRRFGPYVAVLLLVVAVAVGGWRAYAYFGEGARAETARRFAAADALLAAGRAGDAAAAFAGLADDATAPGYAALARLRAAAAFRQAGDARAADDALDRLASDADAPEPLRGLGDYAALADDFDGLAPSEANARLSALAGASPWRFGALELQAVNAVRAGDAADARRLLQSLSADVEAPAGLRARADELLLALDDAGGRSPAPSTTIPKPAADVGPPVR